MTDSFPQVENTDKQKETFRTIVICWPSDSKFPTILGKWKRLPDQRILATYTRDELALCIRVFESIDGTDARQ